MSFTNLVNALVQTMSQDPDKNIPDEAYAAGAIGQPVDSVQVHPARWRSMAALLGFGSGEKTRPLNAREKLALTKGQEFKRQLEDAAEARDWRKLSHSIDLEDFAARRRDRANRAKDRVDALRRAAFLENVNREKYYAWKDAEELARRKRERERAQLGMPDPKVVERILSVNPTINKIDYSLDLYEQRRKELLGKLKEMPLDALDENMRKQYEDIENRVYMLKNARDLLQTFVERSFNEGYTPTAAEKEKLRIFLSHGFGSPRPQVAPVWHPLPDSAFEEKTGPELNSGFSSSFDNWRVPSIPVFAP